MPRTPAQIKTDLLKGLAGAKRDIVSIKLSDLRAVVPGRDDLLSVLGRDDYAIDWLFDAVPDAVKFHFDQSGRKHRVETVRNVAVQREKLLALLREQEPEPAETEPK